MRKLTAIGILCWFAVLVFAFQQGQRSIENRPATGNQTPPTSSRSFDSDQKAQRNPAYFITRFESFLPERDDILTHDDLWLTAGTWAAEEPEAAANWLNKLELGDPRNPYLFSALSQWATTDPQAATRWLEDNSPESETSRLYLKAALIRGMARTDSDAALQYLLSNPAPKSFARSTIDFILGAKAREGSTPLFDALNSLPADRSDLRLAAFKKAPDQLSLKMIPAATQFSKTLTVAAERLAFQTALANRWALNDPAKALAWAEDLPDSTSRPQVLGTVAKQWARQEPLAASAWLNTQQDTAEYDLSARSVAWSVVGLDPSLAFSQVDAMTSQNLRLETFEQLGRFWISDQPGRARSFLEGENPIPPDIRNALLSHFQ